jgi:hypothetical protein
MDIVVIDPIRTNMVQRASTATTHAMMIAYQKKTQSYVKQTPCNNFIPLAIDTYGCFHSRFDSFFTTYAQTTIE